MSIWAKIALAFGAWAVGLSLNLVLCLFFLDFTEEHLGGIPGYMGCALIVPYASIPYILSVCIVILIKRYREWENK